VTKRCAINTLFLAIMALALVSLPSVAHASVTLNDYEKQVLGLVNKERAKRGLVKLSVNTKLTRAAREHSRDMGMQQYFAHNSPSGETWRARIIRHGYTPEGCSYWKVGENIFWGAGLYSSPVYVVDRWMASTAHRQVILTKAFRAAGVGAVRCRSGYGGCPGDVWFFTLDLGRRKLL
jgi:uncharacterized protein YkwD